jgi:hypothetical protein
MLISRYGSVFFIPYSKTHVEFNLIRERLLMSALNGLEVFTEEDVSHLPFPVKKYFIHCGYINTPKSSI